MSNMLQRFVDENLGEMRFFIENGEVWFVATDICRALNVGNVTRALSRLDDDERSTLTLSKSREFVAGARSLSVVNEPGMWRLVLSSRKECARSVKRWIAHTVLPSIRKNGGYIEGQENLSSDEFEKLKTEIKALCKKVENKDFRIARLEAEVEELEMENSDLKKAEYANAYSSYLNEDY